MLMTIDSMKMSLNKLRDKKDEGSLHKPQPRNTKELEHALSD